MPAMTRLQAINKCLRAISEAPVSNLVSDQSLDVAIAEAELDQATMEFCQQGYWFNEDDGVQLTPNTGGEILIPENALTVDGSNATTGIGQARNGLTGSGNREDRDIVPRGRRLWDRANRTFTFDSPVFARVVYLMPFEDLPAQAQTYVSSIAATRVAESQLPGSANFQQALQRENLDQARFHRYENEQSDINASSSNTLSSDLYRRSLEGGSFSGRFRENDLI